MGVIKWLMGSLDNTNARGSTALDAAIKACSNFVSMQAAIDKMVSDCKQQGHGRDNRRGRRRQERQDRREHRPRKYHAEKFHGQFVHCQRAYCQTWQSQRQFDRQQEFQQSLGARKVYLAKSLQLLDESRPRPHRRKFREQFQL